MRAAINGIGAVTTGIVAIEVGHLQVPAGRVDGARPGPAADCHDVGDRQHYRRIVGAQRPETPLDPAQVRLRPIIPIANLAVPAQQALAFARAIAPDEAITVVHVSDDVAAADRLRMEWERWPHGGTRLVVIESPYRTLAGPLLALHRRGGTSHSGRHADGHPARVRAGHWWEHLLHNQTALRLKAALLFHPGIIVANVPYHLARRGR